MEGIMSRINEYRAKAAQFIALAEKSADLNSRVMLLELAGKLAALANTAERNESKYGVSRAA
jgi:hypothetical protein